MTGKDIFKRRGRQPNPHSWFPAAAARELIRGGATDRVDLACTVALESYFYMMGGDPGEVGLKDIERVRKTYQKLTEAGDSCQIRDNGEVFWVHQLSGIFVADAANRLKGDSEPHFDRTDFVAGIIVKMLGPEPKIAEQNLAERSKRQGARDKSKQRNKK